MIGAAALYLLFGWLLSAAAASYLSDRKGYGEKAGLASGLLLFVIGVAIWLVWPAREGSRWKTIGPFRNERRRRTREAGERHAAREREVPPTS